jgi:hypothetical protein
MVGAALKVLQQGHPAAHHVGRRQGHAPAGLRRQPPHATGQPSSTRGGTKSTSSATTASADSYLRRRRRRRPFRHEGRSPRVRTRSFTARAPDLRRRALVTRASRFMARSPCSAPPHPVLVHRPAIALSASFTPSSGPDALRFASLAVTSSRVDFHLQDRAHAGRTMKKGGPGPPSHMLHAGGAY